MIEKTNYNKIGIWIAILSFLIGTLFFAVFLYFKNIDIAISAYFFILAAVIINGVVLVIILSKIKRNLSQRKNYFKTIAIMLINIPIVIVYLCIAIPMVDYIRNTIELTLVNNTEKPILEISAANCDTKTIEKLDVQESKTLYINITHDCSLSLFYNKDNDKQTEIISGYVTTGGGFKKTFYFDK